jgi:beta-glucanase (GH16 family)
MTAARATLALSLLAAGCTALPIPERGPRTAASAEWTLVWSDEFDGPAGASPDSSKWRADTADGCQMGICGWGNQEKQFYTARDNASLDGRGHLAIVARVAPAGLTCYYGPCRYTSAKLTTRGRFHAEPGMVEARIRLPGGQGLWPAFWMLGAGYPATPWPQAGELDIMENHGSQPAMVSSAIHGPGYSGQTPFVGATVLSDGSFAHDFHTFAVAWDSLRIRFFRDGAQYHERRRADVERHGPWAFDHPFFVLLNLAVGGTFDGDPQSDAILPATMVVDYVRAYRRR